MSGWDAEERRVREAWKATSPPDGLRASFRAAVARGAAPRRTLRPLALAVGIAILLAAAGVGVGAHRLGSSSSTSAPPAPSQAPRVSPPPPSPSPAPTAVDASTWAARHLGDGPVVDMALSPTAVYALVAAPGSTGDVRRQTQLVRIELATGAVSSTNVMTLATSVVVAGGDVWVGMGGSLAGGVSAPAQVQRRDPGTLLPLGTTALRTTGPSAGGPAVTVHLAAGPGTVWAAYGPDLFAMDPNSGAVLRTIGLGDTVSAQDVAVAPRGDVVYTSVEDASLQTSILDEWDSTSGRIVPGGHTAVRGLGPLRLAATDTGVWTTLATGTLATLAFRPTANLSAAPPPGGEGQHSNQVRAVVTGGVPGGVLWILDAQTLACADASTGAVRASVSMPGAVTVVAGGGRTYLGSASGVDLLAPDPLCRA